MRPFTYFFGDSSKQDLAMGSGPSEQNLRDMPESTNYGNVEMKRNVSHVIHEDKSAKEKLKYCCKQFNNETRYFRVLAFG